MESAGKTSEIKALCKQRFCIHLNIISFLAVTHWSKSPGSFATSVRDVCPADSRVWENGT
jgi:hypothetical protein